MAAGLGSWIGSLMGGASNVGFTDALSNSMQGLGDNFTGMFDTGVANAAKTPSYLSTAVDGGIKSVDTLAQVPGLTTGLTQSTAVAPGMFDGMSDTINDYFGSSVTDKFGNTTKQGGLGNIGEGLGSIWQMNTANKNSDKVNARADAKLAQEQHAYNEAVAKDKRRQDLNFGGSRTATV